MILLNVSFGIYAFLPQGWIFMLMIILIEGIGLSKFLTGKLKNYEIFMTALLSNFSSGFIGIVGSMAINGGWWLVVWFPWVGSNEVRGQSEFSAFIVFYLIAFILTLIIESIINVLILKDNYKPNSVLKNTFKINAISYLVGSLILYGYSFG